MRNYEENLENEVWVTHPIGIRVSSLGRVETRNKGKHFGSKNSTPYLQVGWQGKTYQVHRLICESFKDNPNNLPYVNHKDENKQNNRADNLEWCTHQYNLNYGTAQERRVANTDYKARTAKMDYKAIAAKMDYKAIGEKVGEKLSIPILQLNKNLEVVQEWSSAKQAERDGGFHHCHISECCKGNRKSHKGYIWRYKKNGEA